MARVITVNLQAERARLAEWLSSLPAEQQEDVLARLGISTLAGLPAHRLPAAWRMIKAEVEMLPVEVQADNVRGFRVESGSARIFLAEPGLKMPRDPHGVIVTVNEDSYTINGASLSRAVHNLIGPYLNNILSHAGQIVRGES